MKLRRKTPGNEDFWAGVEAARKEVDSWPLWKQSLGPTVMGLKKRATILRRTTVTEMNNERDTGNYWPTNRDIRGMTRTDDIAGSGDVDDLICEIIEDGFCETKPEYIRAGMRAERLREDNKRFALKDVGEAEAKAKEPARPECCGCGSKKWALTKFFSTWFCDNCISEIIKKARPDEFNQTVKGLKAKIAALEARGFQEMAVAAHDLCEAERESFRETTEEVIKRRDEWMDDLEKRLGEPGRVAMRMTTALNMAEQGIVTALHGAKDALMGETPLRQPQTPTTGIGAILGSMPDLGSDEEILASARVAEREDLAASRYFESRKDLTGSELCADCGFRMAAVEGNPLCREHNGRTPNDICGYLTIRQSSRWVPRVAEKEEPPLVEPTGDARGLVNCKKTVVRLHQEIVCGGPDSPGTCVDCDEWRWDRKTAGITDEPEAIHAPLTPSEVSGAVNATVAFEARLGAKPNPDIITPKIDLEGVPELFVDGELQSDLIPDEIEVGLWASLDILTDGTLRPSSWGSGWVRGCEARVIGECLVAAGIVALVFYYDQEPFAKVTRPGLGLEPV